jgi:hypothetical protein
VKCSRQFTIDFLRVIHDKCSLIRCWKVVKQKKAAQDNDICHNEFSSVHMFYEHNTS